MQRPEKSETSLALVPKDHPLLKTTSIEGETSGLLDRILDTLQEDTRLDEASYGGPSNTGSDVLLVLATLNSLGTLIKNRPSIESKIINSMLLFNPFKVFGKPPVSTKSKVMLRSIERTVRALFFNILKR
jgi:symplekin